MLSINPVLTANVKSTAARMQRMVTLTATSVVARMAGIVDEVFIKEGTSGKAGELLMTIKVKD